MVTTVKLFEVMTSILLKGTLGSVASLLAANLYQGNPYRNHNLWNIVYTPYVGAAGMVFSQVYVTPFFSRDPLTSYVTSSGSKYLYSFHSRNNFQYLKMS